MISMTSVTANPLTLQGAMQASRVAGLSAHTSLFGQEARGFLARLDAERVPAGVRFVLPPEVRTVSAARPGPLARGLPLLLAGVLTSAPGCRDDDCRNTSTCPIPPDCMEYNREDGDGTLRLSPSKVGEPCGENDEGVCNEKGLCVVTVLGAGGAGGTYAEGGGGSAGAAMGDKRLGELCAGPAECQSGYCIDKVCCNEPCDGACYHCLGTMDFPIGTCIAHPEGFLDTACTPYLCGGGGACIEKCTTDQDCVPWWYLCDTFKGECIKPKQ